MSKAFCRPKKEDPNFTFCEKRVLVNGELSNSKSEKKELVCFVLLRQHVQSRSQVLALCPRNCTVSPLSCPSHTSSRETRVTGI